MMTDKEYVDRGGCKCPVCSSSNINSGFMEADGVASWCNVRCGFCGSNWVDMYELKGFDNMEIPEDRCDECGGHKQHSGECSQYVDEGKDND